MFKNDFTELYYYALFHYNCHHNYTPSKHTQTSPNGHIRNYLTILEVCIAQHKRKQVSFQA
jgi:hypothetical protein